MDLMSPSLQTQGNTKTSKIVNGMVRPLRVEEVTFRKRGACYGNLKLKERTGWVAQTKERNEHKNI
jgi:hypothetical protein